MAYQDVKKAFLHFLNHLNDDQPFFLAGHSQGSLIGMRLLEECIEGQPYLEKLIAAYLPGYKFPNHKFDYVFKQIKKGNKPNDLHCVLAWDTFLLGSSLTSQIDNSMTWATDKDGNSSWKKRIGYKCFGVNPLSFDASNSKCGKEHNLGAVINEFHRDKNLKWSDVSGEEAIGLETVRLSKPKPGFVSAELQDDGILYISKPDAYIWRVGVIPFGNYHVYDYNLFYMNIRKNVLLRWKTYQEIYGN